MKKIFALTIILLAPSLTFAATNMNLAGLVKSVIDYLNIGLVLLMALAVFMFIWYTIKYFIMEAGSDNRKEAWMYILYSIVGFFIILSFWGLVNILQNTFNLGNQDNSPSSWNDITNIFPPTGSYQKVMIESPDN